MTSIWTNYGLAKIMLILWIMSECDLSSYPFFYRFWWKKKRVPMPLGTLSDEFRDVIQLFCYLNFQLALGG